MKILVGISGGLDSGCAAKILKNEGHTVEGAFLRMFDDTDPLPAQKAAEELGIPLHIIDCRDDFEKYVLAPFTACYKKGLTPNPCVECNRYVKIKRLCDFAKERQFDRVVTGHYAKIRRLPDGRYCVARSSNEKKDQSYMLWGLGQRELSMLDLPLADESKDDLKKQAAKDGMSFAGSKESMDICFLPDGGYDKFIESRIGICREGDFIDINGNIIGRHKGIIHYTIGQRKHLGASFGEHMFVYGIDPEKNTVTLVREGEEYRDTATVKDLNFGSLEKRTSGSIHTLTVKMRYAQKPVPVHVTFSGEEAHLLFDDPVRAVAPGQSAVFYDGELVAFGGYIAKE